PWPSRSPPRRARRRRPCRAWPSSHRTRPRPSSSRPRPGPSALPSSSSSPSRCLLGFPIIDRRRPSASLAQWTVQQFVELSPELELEAVRAVVFRVEVAQIGQLLLEGPQRQEVLLLEAV